VTAGSDSSVYVCNPGYCVVGIDEIMLGSVLSSHIFQAVVVLLVGKYHNGSHTWNWLS
jgi:hypothetical protein